MKLGLQYWTFSTPADPAEIAPTLAETARIAEQAGIFSITVMDHYFQMELAGSTTADEPMLEGYTTLGYLAGKTERVILGLLVTGSCTATRGSSPRSLLPSTYCPADGPGWASARPGRAGIMTASRRRCW